MGPILHLKASPSFTNFYRQFFKIFKIKFFMDGTQKKLICGGKLSHTHPLLFLYLWDRKKIVTNNKKLLNSYICHSECSNYQITVIVFFIFRSVGEGGVVWGLLNLINSLQKSRQPPSCIVKFLQIMCSSCIHLILVIL